LASIRERKGARGTSFTVLYRHDGKQRSDRFDTRKEAVRHAERIDRLGADAARRILHAERESDPDQMPTVAQQIDRHINGLSGVQTDTIRSYRTIAKQIAATTLGHLPIDAVSRDDVARWVREQQDTGSAAKTIRNRQGVLSAALGRAVDDAVIPRNPALKVRIGRTERREMTVLTPAEVQILLARVHEHYRPLIMTLYGTGLRLGEATALQVRDIHLEHTPATLTVARAWKRDGVVGAPKTKAGRRTISIPAPVVDVIKPLLEDKRADELVFTNLAGARVLQASLHDLWQGWIRDFTVVKGQPVERKAKLRKVPRIHDLRHSHASVMIANGINLYDLRHRLGHESITTTADTYGHMLPEAQVHAERAASLAFAPSTPAIES
jgi:integrase